MAPDISERSEDRTSIRQPSSKWTTFYKRVFPALFIVGPPTIAISVYVAKRLGFGQPLRQEDLIVISLLSILLPIGGYVACKFFVFDLVDEVWDNGDALFVKKGEVEERIPLANCTNIHWNVQISPPRMTVYLRTPCELGSEFAFMIPFTPKPTLTPPLARELVRRIDNARQAAPQAR